MLAQVRQGGAIDPLGAEHVDVIELGELLRREGLGGAEHHVAGIMHDDVDAAVRGEDRGNAGVDRLLRADVELDGAKIDAVASGIAFDVGDLRRVAARGLAHGRVDGVACLSERFGG